MRHAARAGQAMQASCGRSSCLYEVDLEFTACSVTAHKLCLPAFAAAAAAALPEPRRVLPGHRSASATHLGALGHATLLVTSRL